MAFIYYQLRPLNLDRVAHKRGKGDKRRFRMKHFLTSCILMDSIFPVTARLCKALCEANKPNAYTQEIAVADSTQ